MLDSSAYSLSVENIATTGTTIRGITRIVLVNENGSRVIDTLVCPKDLPEGEKYVAKDGIKL
jgi:hypothetical protein